MDSTATISVSGPDAFSFLQGQLTNDLRRLEADPSLLAAWCNPKGRVICLLRVTRDGDGYALELAADLADSVVKRLGLFRFRANVEFAVSGEQPWPAEAAIERGEPFIGTAQSEKFTPHMLNLDLLDGISFDKGCYTGQEVVARTHYKGATKRRALRFRSESAVAVGDKVTLDGRDVGEVLNAAGNELLAVVPVDKASEALLAGDAALTPERLPYLEA